MSTMRTAIVTGGSQGIGAGLVTRFLEKGYNVVGNSRAISNSTNLTPSPRLALVDGDIGDYATAQKIADTAIAAKIPGILWTHSCKMSSFQNGGDYDFIRRKAAGYGRNQPPKTGGPKGHRFGSWKNGTTPRTERP
jgi:NAD(P)-dependent dehydrogenase (short-subunit alcohol dehydrogenase family)